MDFLAENNHCGQTLLKLVSRGNSSLAELLRLKDNIPKIYTGNGNANDKDSSKYGPLIQMDFTYFKSGEYWENKLEKDENLQDLDEGLKESYLQVLTRFYRLFQSIHRYVSDLRKYIADLDEGIFIQQTLESVFLDADGKQLLCEALYLIGILLLLTDKYIPGTVRERLLVAYHRYSGQHSDESHIDDICQLLRSTGFNPLEPAAKRPANYPESLFERVNLPAHYIRMVIGRLRSDDIYNQITSYPNPEHRSSALSGQASMLFISLFFTPSILKNETATMREIVDKFFPDNWIVSYSMGTVANLVQMWDPYKAAKAALYNTLQPSNLKGQFTPETKSVRYIWDMESNNYY